jgi:hypothetical protein
MVEKISLCGMKLKLNYNLLNLRNISDFRAFLKFIFVLFWGAPVKLFQSKHQILLEI